jgi:hypothetical protein
MARVWFFRQADPPGGDVYAAVPIVYANGAPVGNAPQGTVFFHDFPPGKYRFTVQPFGTPTREHDTLQLMPGMQSYVQVLFSRTHTGSTRPRGELLDLTVERVRSLPVLLIVTFRPEFQPPWTGQPQVTILALNRLDRRDRTALVVQIAGGKVLPADVVDQIADRTDGVPLFVEELTKSVLESGLLREEADRYVLDGALPPLAIPTTLHDSLMSRLDRLASVERVAQIGAAIGREFSHELLAAVARRTDAQLTDALDQLVVGGLVFRRGTPLCASYIFKHALVQEAAYSTLLPAAGSAGMGDVIAFCPRGG